MLVSGYSVFSSPWARQWSSSRRFGSFVGRIQRHSDHKHVLLDSDNLSHDDVIKNREGRRSTREEEFSWQSRLQRRRHEADPGFCVPTYSQQSWVQSSVSSWSSGCWVAMAGS